MPQLIQVPPQPVVGPWLWKPDVAYVDDRTGQEPLGCTIEPAQQEQGVFTGGFPAFSLQLSLPDGGKVCALTMIGSPEQC